MSDYIIREALIKAVEGNPYVTESVKSYVRCTAKNIPSADVVGVVRCRECEGWVATENSDLGLCALTKRVVTRRDYCSWGERKDGSDNG